MALIGVIGGGGGILVQRYWHRIDDKALSERAERERLQGHVLDSLKWFEGKSQKRIIGISVIEGNWDRFTDLHATWAGVLTNQAVYLLAESDQSDAAHECSNLNRIGLLLRKADLSPEQKATLRSAIEQNKRGKGLKLDANELRSIEDLIS